MATKQAQKPHRKEDVVKWFKPQGVAMQLFNGPVCRAPELVLSGPAGTGKSRSALQKVDAIARKYPNCRILIVRKTRASLTNTGLITWEQWVLPEGTTISLHSTTQTFNYPNGAKVVLGGLDKATKIMSAEYDIIFVQEATELTILDWESLLTRLRNGVVPYQQIIADCNPGAPSHWLYQRSLPRIEIDKATGKEKTLPPSLVMLTTSHEDNPRFFNYGGLPFPKNKGDYEPKPSDGPLAWTPEGLRYLSFLDSLTGVRKDRLRWGKWTAAEGVIYQEWDPNHHLISRDVNIGVDENGEDVSTPRVQKGWRRYWVIDFGVNHPFVWQHWAEDGDGTLFLVHEIHMTGRIVADHCKTIRRVTKGEPMPDAIICDHDLEGRMTIERELGMRTIPAYKSVKDGIQAVQQRLRKSDVTGKARIFVLKDSLVEVDRNLIEQKKPLGIEDEILSYVWYSGPNVKKQEEPLKENDDSMDCMRYMVAFKDCRGANQGAPAAGGVRVHSGLSGDAPSGLVLPGDVTVGPTRRLAGRKGRPSPNDYRNLYRVG